MKTYPVNLVLENELVVLVGAMGEITHKIPGLLEVGAKVKIIAPDADPEVIAYAETGQIEWLKRAYQPGDLSGAFMVIAANGLTEYHEAIWAEAEANNQLANIMDVIPKCNFHAASLVRRGQLTISIGTGGAAPALAVTLRKRFEKEFGPEYAEFLDHAQELRPILKQRLPKFKDRLDFWYALVESEALDLLRQGQKDLFEEKIETLILAYAGDAEAV